MKRKSMLIFLLILMFGVWKAHSSSVGESEIGVSAIIEGEVVDSACYIEAGKRGPDHKDCATYCATNGQTLAISDDKDQLYILW